jgi:hypothetical protein
MQSTESRMAPSYRVSASRRIAAAPARIYAVLADYHVGHPSILASAFSNLVIEEGGVGAGTVVRFDMRVLGKTQRVRGVVSEPEPGRVLVESYPESGVITTFQVDAAAPAEAVVTIASDVPVRPGLAGSIERWVATRALRRILTEELERIDIYLRDTQKS